MKVRVLTYWFAIFGMFSLTTNICLMSLLFLFIPLLCCFSPPLCSFIYPFLLTLLCLHLFPLFSIYPSPLSLPPFLSVSHLNVLLSPIFLLFFSDFINFPFHSLSCLISLSAFHSSRFFLPSHLFSSPSSLPLPYMHHYLRAVPPVGSQSGDSLQSYLLKS